MDDLLGLLGLKPDRTAAMVQALRGQQGQGAPQQPAQPPLDVAAYQQPGMEQQSALGNLAMLTGDRVIAPYGQQQVAQVQAGQGRALQQALEARRQVALDRRASQGDALRLALGTQQAAASRALAERDQSFKLDKERRSMTEGLRKELQLLPEAKEFRGIATAYDAVVDSAKDPSGTGGTATIFNFMKMIDPGVAVMEGDVDRIKASGGPAARFANIYQEALTGNPLPEEVRDAIVRRATSIYSLRRDAYAKVADQYARLAQEQGIDPEDVVLTFGALTNPDELEKMPKASATASGARKPAAPSLPPARRGPDGTLYVLDPQDGTYIAQE